MTKLRRLARDQHCMVRLPGVCNRDSATTVLAHLRLAGLSGLGFKCPDALAAWTCAACHQYCDTHHDDVTKVAFYEGIFRTQAKLLKEGLL